MDTFSYYVIHFFNYLILNCFYINEWIFQGLRWSFFSGKKAIFSGKKSILSGKKSILSGKKAIFSGRKVILSTRKTISSGRKAILSGRKDGPTSVFDSFEGERKEIHCAPAAVSVVCGCYLDMERIVHLFTVFNESEIRLQR
jgi:hypothetical protein